VIRCSGILISVVLSSLVLASSPALPWVHGTNNPIVFSPESKPYGFSLGEWNAKAWQRDFSISSASDIEQDAGGNVQDSCAINQTGPVWFLTGTGSGGVEQFVCTIPVGKAVLWSVLAGMCSYADTPNAKSDSELRSCAMSGNEGAIIEVNINGVKLEDIDKYRVQSSPFNLTISEGNPYGILPGPTTAVADCWCIMIEPLPVGNHVLQSTVSIPGNPTIGMSALASDHTYHLIVQEQQSEAIAP
jgi:hypothetical protein